MDIIKFLQHGNIVPNPNYNPKTKKGALEPPTLVDNNPGSSLRDQGRNALFSRITGQSYNLNQYADSNYADYNVYINPVDSQEELDKERAINQSNLEQSLNSIGQFINQGTIGIAVGFADLADAIYNWFTNQPQDYNSPITKTLEDFKNSIDERLAIYRENPNAAFDVTDFAWWASNIPTIASSISLMVPGYGVTKGLSMLGKVSTLSKIGNKIATSRKLSNKGKEIASRLGQSITTGTTMRYLENYQEARQTYNDVHKMVTNNLKAMNEQQRNEFIKNNPQFEGKSDEEIANIIAENSADVTFAADWANVFFDIAQVYTIGNLWKNALGGQTTSRLNRLNKTAASNFGKDAATITEQIANKTFKDKAITNLKDLVNDIKHGVRAEWTEGIEEGINFISSQEGLYAGQKIFDKNAKRSDLIDYLTDPHLWEQAFWGAIGGVAFSGAMNKIGEFVNKKIDADWTKAEEQKEAEILGRSIITDAFKQNLDAIKDGKNPFNGNKPIVPGTEDSVRELAIQEYVDNLVMGALNVGNGKLLKEFASDNNLVKGIQEKLGINQTEAANLQQSLIESIDRVEGVYLDVLNKVDKFGGDFNIGRILASKTARAKISKELYQKSVDWAQSQVTNEINKDGVDVSSLEIEDALQAIYRATKQSYEDEIRNIEASAEIDKQVKLEQIDSIKENIKALDSLIIEADETIVSNQNKAFSKIAKNYSDITQDLYNLASSKVNLAVKDKYINLSDNYIKEQIKEYKLLFDQATKKLVKAAYDDVYKMIEKYGGEVFEDVAIHKNTNDNVDNVDAKIMRKAYNALKLNAPSNKHLENTINDIIKNINRKNDTVETVEENAEEENPFVGVEEVLAKEEAEEKEAEEIKAGVDSSSTGGGTQTVTEETINPVNVEEQSTEEEIKAAPIEKSTRLVDTLPDDDWERGQAINDAIYEQLSSRDDINLDNNDTVIAAEQSLIDYLVEQGISTVEATIEVNNVINLFRYSTISKANRLIVNARKAVLTGNELNAEAVIEEFVNSVNSENVPRAKKINGVTYFNLGKLLEYVLNEANNNKLIKDYLFSPLKSYIYSQANNGKYVLTDSDVVRTLNDKNASQYIDEFAKARRDRLLGRKQNNVNVEWLEDEELFDNFTTVKPDDVLEPIVDKAKGRIALTINAKPVGYIGIPNSKDGKYQRYNRSWNYEIDVTKEGIVSPLKDLFVEMIDSDNANEEFLSLLYNLTSLNREEITPELLIELYNKMIESYPRAESFINTAEDNYKTNAALHLVNLAKFASKMGDSFIASVNMWFNDLLNSYDQAKAIIDGTFNGEIKVSSINYGLLNTDDSSTFEGNNISEAVHGYDEKQHELMVTVPDKATGLNKTYSSYGPINGQAPVTRNGIVVIKVPKADGSFAYAHCRQCLFEETSFSNIGKEIKALVEEELISLIDRFLSGRINFNEFETFIKDLIGDDSLITGLYANHPKNNSNARMFTANAKNYFIVNEALGKYPRNIAYYDSNNKIQVIKSSDDTRFASMIIPLVKDYLKNAKFAVGKSFIGDSNFANRDINTYIKRKDNKTIISLRGREFSFNSYQDFLVSTNAVKTKLLGGKSNNFIYNEDVTKLNIIYEVKDTPILTPRREEIDVPVNASLTERTITDVNVQQLTQLINNNTVDKALRNYFNNDSFALEYIANLQKIKMLPKNIVIDNTLSDNGQPAFGGYNETTDSIIVNLNALKDLSHDELIRVLVHERVHQLLTIHYNKEQLIKNIGEVYDEFVDWYNTEASEEDKLVYKDFLYEGKSREYTVEEFIVESMTMDFFMNKLNEIKTKSPIKTQKKQTLLSKLLNIIANFFNIKINEDSLLAKANAYYTQAVTSKPSKTKRKIKTEATQGVLNFKEQTENETAVVKEEENNNKKIDFTEKVTDSDISLDIPFSAISGFKYRNLSSIIESVPQSRQAEFGRLLDTGAISFMCM